MNEEPFETDGLTGGHCDTLRSSRRKKHLSLFTRVAVDWTYVAYFRLQQDINPGCKNSFQHHKIEMDPPI